MRPCMQKTSRETAVDDIMKLAGELDDRWLRDEEAGARARHYTSEAGGKSGHRSASAEKWATRLVTPGEQR